MPKRDLYKIEGDKLVRTRKHCPKCGVGTFLAEHKNRTTCGNCQYTEFKTKDHKTEAKPEGEPKEDKPAEPKKE